MADWAGKTLGKVHINDLIARGGMAEVYTGTHESFGLVAVKVMRGLLERDSDQLARFQREAEVIAELKHPNIVQMMDYTVVDETPCLTMEYINGPSLAAYLKSLHEHKQRLPIGIVAQLLTGIASALDYAHSKGMIHRDIKPANVLLSSPTKQITLNEPLPPDVEPTLTDFGLVRLLDSTMHTTTGSVSGTPAYMSPEQSRGEKVDKRTDIYSLGIMLYEMLAGGVPFQADTTFGMLMKHINEPPPVIKGISPDLQALLDRALAKDPSLRYNSAGELANEFLAIFNGQTVSPGTLHIAELARQAATQAAQGEKPRPEDPPSRRWIRLAVEGTIFLVLGFFLFRVVFPIDTNTPTATPDPNVPVGRMRFSDVSDIMDKVSITLDTGTAGPETGTHYEAWLISDDGTIVKDIGQIIFDASGIGQLVFTDPNHENLLDGFNQVQVTRERDDVSINVPTGEVVYSSTFPPKALVHVRHVMVSFPGAPNEEALMVGLFYYSGRYINYSVNGDVQNDPNFVYMVKAYENGDEATVRKRTEEVINLIVGDQSGLYRDYDGDGILDNADGDGFGSLQNGDRLGYIQETALHAKYSAEAEDSTPNIRNFSANMQICIQNMDGWTKEVLPLAQELNDTPFGPEMKPIIERLSVITNNLEYGVDADKDGIIEPIAGECGASQAYEYGWYFADFPILIGPNRIPPVE
ncbi:MAG: protein kinase [Chloroflexi bacterium]|nr:protein kinase [Chloroflexota bacterium]